jgi:hypothetical protein
MVQVAQHLGALGDAAQRDLADHVRMRQHFAAIEQRDQLRIDGAEMVDPDRSIDQDHASARPATRRRLRVWIAPAQACETACRFALDQRFKGFPHERRLFANAGERFGLGEKVVIKCERGSHGTQYSIK